jgi:hypothetical protein
VRKPAIEHAGVDHRIIVSMNLDFGKIIGLAANFKVGVLLFGLRLLSSLQHRRPTPLVQTEAALEGGATVLVGDARIRVRLTGPVTMIRR